MIVIDTSVLIAILLHEDGSGSFLDIITDSEKRFISSATWVETQVVISHKFNGEAMEDAIEFISSLEMEIIPLTAQQASVAAKAYGRFSALNFGDTFSYALAKEMGAPLLFKGQDFSSTDVQIAGA